MEFTERLNETISYIEEHLTEEISYDALARIACCSAYHFQRMFAYMAGIPLSEYIRRRRMSLAAVDLQSGNEKIIDIGMKYGYASPTAFNRAFQSVHGIAPSMAKKEGTPLKSFPPIRYPPMGVLGVSVCNDNGDWRYFIAVSSCADTDDTLDEYLVPACTWAIFNGSGTGISIQELQQRIVTEWLPASGFEFADAPDMEVYQNPDPDNMQYEVWIPVRNV